MRNSKALVAVGALVVLAGWLFVTITGGGSVGDATATATVSASATLVDEGRSGASTSGLPTVVLSALPPQAQATHEIVLAGGPFPYPQDDGTFGNREGILPDQAYGWYREYTIETPGSPDRGPRRFVVGEDGVFFYTDDHYNSFREVIE